MWYVLAISLAFYTGLTATDMITQWKILFGVAFGTVGLFTSALFGYIRIDLKSRIRLLDLSVMSLLAFVLIVCVNFIVNFGASVSKFAVTWDVATAFVVCMAVFEEMFFRLFLLPLFTRTWLILPKKYGGEFIGVLIVSGGGSIFHFGVYGLDPLALLIVGGGWLVLNYVILYVRRISVTMNAHALNNLLSVISWAVFRI
jgi:membrane protease YdiL (CAAX protease family)